MSEFDNQQEAFETSLKSIGFGCYRDVVFLRDYKGEANTMQFNDGKTVLNEPIDHPVPVEYKGGDRVNAGICDNGDGTVSLEIEGFEYGVGYLHGLTYEDIRIL